MLLMGSTATLHADLIVCPEDDFFKEHEEECKVAGQLYTAAGDAGFVYVFSSPVSSEIVGEIPNGTDIWIDFTYETETGVLWGVQTPKKNLSLGQWMNLTEFEITKTGEDFEREHQAALEPIEKTHTFGEQRGYLTLWAYPGSDQIHNQINSQDVEPGAVIPMTRKYTDEAGQVWFYIEVNERINGWIQEGQELTLVRLNNYWYLDQGTYASATPTPQPTVPTPRVPLDSPSSSDGSVAPYLKKQPELTLMIGAGIAGVIALTALVIVRFWKKR
jgi:hypothetical protein